MMTLAEAAAILSLSPDTLRRQAQRGKLKGRKYGKTWVVTPREVERYAEVSMLRCGSTDPRYGQRCILKPDHQDRHQARGGPVWDSAVLTGGTPSRVSSGYAVQEQGPASVDVRQTSEDG
jgi:excisionase family DNA binding protein